MVIKLITFLCLLALVAAGPIFYSKNNAKLIPNSYIVVMKRGVDKNAVNQMTSQFSKRFGAKDISSFKTYSFKGFNAINVKMSQVALKAYLNDSRIEFIEQDFKVKKVAGEEVYDCPTQQIQDQYFLPQTSYFVALNQVPNIYQYLDNAGSGVFAYVLDTGIYQAHSEFTGRLILGPSFIDGETIDDRDGHGTCCAGILAGTSYGAAKKATIIPIKVLGNDGTGSLSSVISGINWAASDVRSGKKIISLSLRGDVSPSLNAAVAAAVAAGVPVVVAAGNEAIDVSLVSPASEPTAITVAASDISANFAIFSNFGSGVDIIAPGVAIKCATITGPNNFAFLSGTSMATPLVAGVSATLLGGTSISTPAELVAQLQAIARKDFVTNVPASTINRLLYNGCKVNSLTTSSTTTTPSTTTSSTTSTSTSSTISTSSSSTTTRRCHTSSTRSISSTRRFYTSSTRSMTSTRRFHTSSTRSTSSSSTTRRRHNHDDDDDDDDDRDHHRGHDRNRERG